MTNLEFYKEEIISKMYGGNSLNKVVSDLFWEHHYSEKADTSLKCILDWLCEEHSILDKEEKEYLSAVIRPFRDRVNYIYITANTLCSEDEAFMMIVYDDIFKIALPNFKKDKMYKGMKLDKPYTLKDLGL